MWILRTSTPGSSLVSSRRDLDASKDVPGTPLPQKNAHARTDTKHLLDGRRVSETQ